MASTENPTTTQARFKPLNLPPDELEKKRRGPNTKAKRLTDADNNPCTVEANASFQCLHDYNFNRDSCMTEFYTYKNCKKFWNQVMAERRKNGVRPALPPAEERDSIRGGVDYNQLYMHR
ncbi:coiled-coil-helix-coiled-coil-helix domain-containing protein 7-like [Glandiceps talaboti]